MFKKIKRFIKVVKHMDEILREMENRVAQPIPAYSNDSTRTALSETAVKFLEACKYEMTASIHRSLSDYGKNLTMEKKYEFCVWLREKLMKYSNMSAADIEKWVKIDFDQGVVSVTHPYNSPEAIHLAFAKLKVFAVFGDKADPLDISEKAIDNMDMQNVQ